MGVILINMIVFIGDSITNGFPYSAKFSWVNLVAEKLQLDFYNKGINGDTTTGMLNRFQRDVLLLGPTHVIIMGGTNDAYNATNIDLVIQNIYTMIQLAIQHHIVPIVGLPIPCNEYSVEILLDQYREKLRQITFETRLVVLIFIMLWLTQAVTV
jgi:acyl-CoA thioesterase-1